MPNLYASTLHQNNVIHTA